MTSKTGDQIEIGRWHQTVVCKTSQVTNTDPSDIWVQTTFDEIQHYMLQGRKFLPYFEVHDILNQKLTLSP